MSGIARLTKLSLAAGAATAALAVFSPGAMAQASAQEVSANAIVLQSQDLGDALRALARFDAVARAMGVTRIRTVATAAIRDASDGQEFLARPQKARPAVGLSLRQQRAGHQAVAVRHLLGVQCQCAYSLFSRP